MYNGFIMKEDEWSTGLSREIWNARPDDSEEQAKKRIHRRTEQNRVWTNNFGDKFKDGDKVIIKKHNLEFASQGPSYTSEMAELYAESKVIIGRINSIRDVYLDDEGFTWHLDWMKPIRPPLEDELFEI